MSIYHKEKAQYFDRAMQSIWDEQSIKPNEIVLVEDGKLTDELYETIGKWKNKLGKVLKIILLEQNVGLGKALNIGLENCSYDIVARMDTDDISLSHRFEKQIRFMEENHHIDLLSSWIGEFENDEEDIISYRKVPQTHDEIKKFAKKRNPINHPCVVYRKQAVINAGNYQDMIGFEDYYLWVRMLINGSKAANLQEPLLNMRAGFHILERRGGFEYIKNEIKYQNKLKEIGFINSFEYLRNIATRITVRILPKNIRGLAYSLIRKGKQ
jgi:glycosyltransferase involved in cell wall biosynthesis